MRNRTQWGARRLALTTLIGHSLAATMIALAVSMAVAPEPAVAQETGSAQEQSNRHRRGGFWGSFGWGYGSESVNYDTPEGFPDDFPSISTSLAGIASYLRLGGTVSQHVLLGGEGNGFIGTAEDGEDVTVRAQYSFVVYYYPAARAGFFLKGGPGLAIRLQGDAVDSEGSTGLGLTLGTGYDLRVGSNFSLTPFVNWLYANLDQSSATLWQIGLGFTFH